MTPNDLPTELKAEAKALAISLIGDQDALGKVFSF
jgi:hypothetical protein